MKTHKLLFDLLSSVEIFWVINRFYSCHIEKEEGVQMCKKKCKLLWVVRRGMT